MNSLTASSTRNTQFSLKKHRNLSYVTHFTLTRSLGGVHAHSSSVGPSRPRTRSLAKAVLSRVASSDHSRCAIKGSMQPTPKDLEPAESNSSLQMTPEHIKLEPECPGAPPRNNTAMINVEPKKVLCPDAGFPRWMSASRCSALLGALKSSKNIEA